MRIYFAPMEGITDAFFRRAHWEVFGGVDAYYMPFLCPGGKASLTVRERTDIDPGLNRGVPCVPQILTRDPELFLSVSRRLSDLGYQEVNLNLGCPMAMVTAKGRGSGMLRDRNALARFLDTVCAGSALPVSVKTRIGYADPAEWEALSTLLRQYPLKELIVHLRTREEFYRGRTHRELLPTLSAFPFPTAVNGDLFSPGDIPTGTEAVMLGRGLLTNPALARQLRGGPGLTLDALRSFHDKVYTAYMRHWPEVAVASRLHELMGYMSFAFEGSAYCRKRILRSTTVEEYNDAVHRLFSECPLKAEPYFSPEALSSGTTTSSAT